MEDYFQIIFIVIFIVSSIISSMNKKKKQQLAKKSAQQPSVNKAQPVAVKKEQKSSAAILEEILGFKVEVPEPQKQETPFSYGEKEKVIDTWDPTTEYQDVATSSAAKFKANNLDKKAELNRDKEKHQAFKKEIIKPRIIKKDSHKSKFFINKNNLKEYIVVQEILNKPKALRR